MSHLPGSAPLGVDVLANLRRYTDKEILKHNRETSYKKISELINSGVNLLIENVSCTKAPINTFYNSPTSR